MVRALLEDAVFPLDSFVWCCSLPHPFGGAVFLLLLWVVLRLSLCGRCCFGWSPCGGSLFGGTGLFFLMLEALIASSSSFRVLLLLSSVLLGLLLWVVLSSSPSFGWCCFHLLFLLCDVDVLSLPGVGRRFFLLNLNTTQIEPNYSAHTACLSKKCCRLLKVREAMPGIVSGKRSH